MNYLTVAVIVPAYNEEKNVAECIKSLLSLDYPKDRIGIFIVDNNSSDRTGSIIKGFPVTYLLETQRGPYAARNKPRHLTQVEIIAFTDADCVVDRNWVKEIVEAFKDESIAGIGGNILPYKTQTIIEQFINKKRCLHNNEQGLQPERTKYICPGNAAYRRKILDEFGWFDDLFAVGADGDLALCITKEGHRLIYVPTAVVYHKMCDAVVPYLGRLFQYNLHSIRVADKYKETFSQYLSKFSYLKKSMDTCKELIILFFFDLPKWILVSLFNLNDKNRISTSEIIVGILTIVAKETGALYGRIKYNFWEKL